MTEIQAAAALAGLRAQRDVNQGLGMPCSGYNRPVQVLKGPIGSAMSCGEANNTVRCLQSALNVWTYHTLIHGSSAACRFCRAAILTQAQDTLNSASLLACRWPCSGLNNLNLASTPCSSSIAARCRVVAKISSASPLTNWSAQAPYAIPRCHKRLNKRAAGQVRTR